MKFIDTAGDIAEAYLILRDRSNLLSIQSGLENQLAKLEGQHLQNTGHPITLAELSKIQNRDVSFNNAFVRNGAQGSDVLAKAARDAQSTGALSAIARGVAVVDPEQSVWNLSKLPCVNPDFVAALAKGMNDVTGRHPVTRHYGDGVILPSVYYTSAVDPFSYINVTPFNCDPSKADEAVRACLLDAGKAYAPEWSRYWNGMIPQCPGSVVRVELPDQPLTRLPFGGYRGTVIYYSSYPDSDLCRTAVVHGPIPIEFVYDLVKWSTEWPRG